MKVNNKKLTSWLQYLIKDPGQTEYEYPLLSSQESRDKKGLQEPLLSYSEPDPEDNGYLCINTKTRSEWMKKMKWLGNL